jgi:hypothetical protein
MSQPFRNLSLAICLFRIRSGVRQLRQRTTLSLEEEPRSPPHKGVARNGGENNDWSFQNPPLVDLRKGLPL